MNIDTVRVSELHQTLVAPMRKGTALGKMNRADHGLVVVESGTIRFFDLKHDPAKTAPFEVSPGTAILMPKGSDYRDIYLTDGRAWVVNFEAENLNGSDALVTFPCPVGGQMIEDVRRLAGITARPLFGVCEALSLFYGILAAIAQANGTVHAPDFPAMIAPSVEYLYAYYCDPSLTLDRMAARSHISTVYFRKLFTAAAGIPPMKYVNGLRIELACRLLASPDMTVSRVAEECGWCELSHFSEAFHRTVGMTPMAWRKKNLGL